MSAENGKLLEEKNDFMIICESKLCERMGISFYDYCYFQ